MGEETDADLSARINQIMTGTAGPGGGRTAFLHRLDEIDAELVRAALDLAAILPQATRALLQVDRTAVDRLRAATYDVQAHASGVEEQGFVLLAREAPVSGDLRRLVAILRLVTSLDRAAALVRHVAEGVDHLEIAALPREIQDTIQTLSDRAVVVFTAGVDAWRHRDGLAIHEVEGLDEAVDDLQIHLLTSARAVVEGPAELVLLGLLGRYLERIADHGVSFAGHATFAVTGRRLAGPRPVAPEPGA